MAGKSGRKPVSLNDSHYRCLQDLSAPPKPSTNSSDDEDESSEITLKGRRHHEGKHLFRDEEDDSIPRFSSITDFDSPIELRSAEDIVDELSSMVGILSIEKKPVAKAAQTFESDKDVDYDNADSSFSASSSDASKSDFGGIEDLNDPFEDIIDSITLDGPDSTYKLKGNIAKTLFPYQREGLNWLWSLHCEGMGGILADDMGLGKTRQICSFLAGLFDSRLIKRALVVAPKTLLEQWYKLELSFVGLSEKTRKYDGTSDEHGKGDEHRKCKLHYLLRDEGVLLTSYDIVSINYDFLRRNDLLDDEESEDGPIWDYVILDEGHRIKNPDSRRAESLQAISSAHRIILTGTPVQNNLKEFWVLMNFCCPGLLGYQQWFLTYIDSVIARGNEKTASERERSLGSDASKRLREWIGPFFLRRLKDDKDAATKLPQKQEIVVWLRLTSFQRNLYEAFLKEDIVFSACDRSPLAALTILKKICDHPRLLTDRAAVDVEKLAVHADVADAGNFEAEHDVSCKMTFIMSLLDNLIPQGHHVLIFSQTCNMLNLIEECITSKGYKFVRIDGTTKASDRARIVDDFQDGSAAPIFLLTSQVGGLGLTLTKADRVIVADPAWNPSVDNQSVDRAYRIGQKRDVLVYRLRTSGTVEEKMYRRQVYKLGLSKIVTEHKEPTRYFDRQYGGELFCIPEEGFDVSATLKQLEEEHACDDTLNDSFKEHMKFLKRQGIAGVSHHSLLFSKSAPVQDAPEDDQVPRNYGTRCDGTSASTSLERPVDGTESASNPKEGKLSKEGSSPNSSGKLIEDQIREQINRTSLLLANETFIARLPDRGSKLQQLLGELNSKLSKIEDGRKRRD